MDVNIYEGVGGDETFRRLVDAFYRRIETDARIRHMFPPDLAPGKTWQFLFLTQYFGGPQRYNASRGHPRLRMRHPMPIGQLERDAWVQNMHEAIDEVGIAEPYRAWMRQYFADAGTFLINRRTPEGAGAA